MYLCIFVMTISFNIWLSSFQKFPADTIKFRKLSTVRPTFLGIFSGLCDIMHLTRQIEKKIDCTTYFLCPGQIGL